MKKIIGIFALLVVIIIVTGVSNPVFFSAYNVQNLLERISLFGIISIGAAFVIMAGGIDLSIGSVVGLTATLLAWLIREKGISVPVSFFIVAITSLAIGVTHGLLVTKARLQPFLVTLCGLLIYRGLARWIAADQQLGFGNDHTVLRNCLIGKISIPIWTSYTGIKIPIPFLIFAGITIFAIILLNKTIFGRHLLATGRNAQAAKYSGVRTENITIYSYVICSLAAGMGGCLFALQLNSVQPGSMGNIYELYAIAAAVLGGCSLRGGEGSILGVAIGVAVMRVLYNAINLLGIPTQLEFAIIGAVLLAGALADEFLHRFSAKRQSNVQNELPKESIAHDKL